MADRGLLVAGHLPELRVFMRTRGYKSQRPKGLWEKARFVNERLSGPMRTLIFFDTMRGGLVVQEKAIELIQKFLRERKEAT